MPEINIPERIADIRAVIAESAKKSPLGWEEIMLTAVTKTVPPARIAEAEAAGLRVFGENRVQELLAKRDLFPNAAWHLIGHLQTNKVKAVIDKVDMIQSLDSERLAREIENRAAGTGRRVKALLQVNIGEDERKYGLAEKEVIPFLKNADAFPHISICGLMTIGPLLTDPESTRPHFIALRELFIKIKSAGIEGMDYLSMGMSADFRIAVEEGANIVRVGGAIFGERSKNA